jgi:hypothetical protein
MSNLGQCFLLSRRYQFSLNKKNFISPGNTIYQILNILNFRECLIWDNAFYYPGDINSLLIRRTSYRREIQYTKFQKALDNIIRQIQSTYHLTDSIDVSFDRFNRRII